MRVTVTGGADWAEILVEGHAPGPPAGENITCAALSALMYAAAAVAERLWEEGKLREPPEVRLEPGFGRVRVVGEAACVRAVGEMAARIAAPAVRAGDRRSFVPFGDDPVVATQRHPYGGEDLPGRA